MLITNFNKKQLAVSLLIPLAVGGLATLINFSGIRQFEEVAKPAFTPAPIVFSVVWTILYALMGFSFYLIYKSDKSNKNIAYTFYFAQLVVNFIWTYIFFTLKNYLGSFFVIIALLILIAGMIVSFWCVNKKAAYLQIPYMLWVCFVAFLNYQIYILN